MSCHAATIEYPLVPTNQEQVAGTALLPVQALHYYLFNTKNPMQPICTCGKHRLCFSSYGVLMAPTFAAAGDIKQQMCDMQSRHRNCVVNSVSASMAPFASHCQC
jgi:hypothetical protein